MAGRPALAPGFEQLLLTAEQELDRLVDRLDVPIQGGAPTLVLGLARSAAVIFRGLRREARADPTMINATLMLRSLAGAAILVRWLEGNPDLRARMYEAEDDRQRLAAARDYEAWRDRMGTARPPVFDDAQTRVMNARIAKIRAEALAAGEAIGTKGAVLPTDKAMAAASGDANMTDAYGVVYRATSAYVHLGGRSISHQAIEERADGLHLVMGEGLGADAVRAMACPLMAHIVGSASRTCGLGIDAEALVWQRAIAGPAA